MADSTANRKPVRSIAFRLAAVLLALTPLLLIEASVRLLDLGRPNATHDPFVGFHGLRPLFVEDEKAGSRVIAPYRMEFFQPDSFSSVKEPNTFRIFCLGGSTVQGRPYATETSFTTWLRLSLEAAEPARNWEVVNCGGVSYASYRLAPILQEVLGYAPDLIVLYTGHNEFLEDRTYAHVKRAPAFVAQVHERLTTSRAYSLLVEGFRSLRQGARSTREAKPLLPGEVEALLDFRGGLEFYHHDPVWRQDVIAHYASNLRRMIRMAEDKRVPLILMNPVSSLRDCPPFKSEHRPGLTADELTRWNHLRREASRRYGSDLGAAVRQLNEALAIDDQHAGLWYEIGQSYDSLGMIEQAREAFIQAKERDVCPLRMLEPMHAALLEIAADADVPLVDVRQRFEAISRWSIPGGDWLVDHVHPSIEGHKKIAEWLLEALVREGLVKPHAGWRERRDRRYRDHLASLDDFYYLRGEQRLRNLRRWAAGRVKLTRPQPTETPAPSSP